MANSNGPRLPPQSAIQAGGQVASDVVGSLKNQPALLAVVVLNVIGLAAGVWFMSQLIETSRLNHDHLIQIVASCVNPAGR